MITLPSALALIMWLALATSFFIGILGMRCNQCAKERKFMNFFLVIVLAALSLAIGPLLAIYLSVTYSIDELARK